MKRSTSTIAICRRLILEPVVSWMKFRIQVAKSANEKINLFQIIGEIILDPCEVTDVRFDAAGPISPLEPPSLYLPVNWYRPPPDRARRCLRRSLCTPSPHRTDRESLDGPT